jgi:hypothetical protein
MLPVNQREPAGLLKGPAPQRGREGGERLRGGEKGKRFRRNVLHLRMLNEGLSG